MNWKLAVAALAGAMVVAGCTNANLVGGRNYVDQGVYDKAVTVLEKAVQELPDDPEAHFLLGKSYAARQNYEKAAVELNRTSELDPGYYKLRADTVRQDNHAKLFKSGNELLNAGQFEEALDRYQKALLFKPEAADVRTNVAYAYTKLGRRDEAAQEYIRIYELDNKNVDALKTAIQMMLEDKKRDQAIALCQRFLEEHPGDLEVTSVLSDIHMSEAEAARDRGDSEGQKAAIRMALPLWEGILTTDPENKTARYQVGVCHYTLEDFPRAAENFEMVVEQTEPRDQLHVDALSNLSAALYKMKQFGTAEEHIRELIALEPEECGHYRLLSGALREQGRSSEALEAAKSFEDCNERNK